MPKLIQTAAEIKYFSINWVGLHTKLIQMAAVPG
jgi:hypothetical protein